MATTEAKLTTPEYLTKLGWDASKWTVLTEEQWLPLQKVSGYQTYVYDAVKDPIGRGLFGKNARVVKTEWMNKNMASVTEVKAPETKIAPPPSAPPAAPPKAPPAVPQDIKEIADASPNVVIASVPKAENSDLGLRKAQMAAISWTIETDKDVMSKDDKTISFEELSAMTNDEFYAMLAEPTKKAETKKEEEVEVEEIIVEQEFDKFVHDRADQLISYRFTVDEKDKHILHTSDGEMITYEEIDAMENDDWIAYVKLYKSLTLAKPGEERALRDAQLRKEEERSKLADAEKIEAQRAKDLEARTKVANEAAAKLQAEADKNATELAEKEAKEKADADKALADKKEADQKEADRLLSEAEAEVMAKKAEKRAKEKEMTTGDIGGFFSQIATVGFGSSTLQMNKLEDGKISVQLMVSDTDDTCSSKVIHFKEIVGTPEELDKIFMDKIRQPFK